MERRKNERNQKCEIKGNARAKMKRRKGRKNEDNKEKKKRKKYKGKKKWKIKTYSGNFTQRNQNKDERQIKFMEKEQEMGK